MSSLSLSNVSYTYKRTGFSIGPLDLTVHSGEIHTVLGPSGSGKSTILKLITGLLPPDSGTVEIGGSDLTHTQPQFRNISMVFQEPLLFPGMTIVKNAAFGLKMKKVPKKERTDRAFALLKQVGIHKYAEAYPGELSGGQQQRAAIARALAVNPRIILMDEPFSALDPELRWEMRELVKQMRDTTVIFVTHDRDEAFYLSDTISVMRDGKITQTAHPQKLFFEPADLFTARFIGHENIIEGIISENTFSNGSISIKSDLFTSYNEEKISIIIPPEAFSFTDNNCVQNKNMVTLHAVIKNVSNRLGLLYIDVSVNGLSLKMTVKNEKRLSVKHNTETLIQFDPIEIIIPKNGTTQLLVNK